MQPAFILQQKLPVLLSGCHGNTQQLQPPLSSHSLYGLSESRMRLDFQNEAAGLSIVYQVKRGI